MYFLTCDVGVEENSFLSSNPDRGFLRPIIIPVLVGYTIFGVGTRARVDQ